MKKNIFMMALLAGFCFLAEDAVGQQQSKSFMKPPNDNLRQSKHQTLTPSVANTAKIQTQTPRGTVEKKTFTTTKECEISTLSVNDGAPTSSPSTSIAKKAVKPNNNSNTNTTKKVQATNEKKTFTTSKSCEISTLTIKGGAPSSSSTTSVSKTRLTNPTQTGNSKQKNPLVLKQISKRAAVNTHAKSIEIEQNKKSKTKN